jgi:hypothetical protein
MRFVLLQDLDGELALISNLPLIVHVVLYSLLQDEKLP